MAGLFKRNSILSQGLFRFTHNEKNELYNHLEKAFKERFFKGMTNTHIRELEYRIYPNSTDAHETMFVLQYIDGHYQRVDFTICMDFNILREWGPEDARILDEVMTQLSREYIEYFNEHCDKNDSVDMDALAYMRCTLGLLGGNNNE